MRMGRAPRRFTPRWPAGAGIEEKKRRCARGWVCALVANARPAALRGTGRGRVVHLYGSRSSMDQRDAVPLLTDEQIRHFKREGYVICYGLLPEELMAACRQRLWQDPPTSMRASDPTSWLGPLATKDETGSGMHGIAANSRSGYIWKERVAGGEQLMLDLLPKRLAPIAEQLLGPGVFPPTGESVGAMLGVPDDQHFPAELDRVARSSDIGISPLCARFLSLIHTHNFPVPLPPEAKLHDMFVVGSRARGIYATLPQQLGTQRPFVTGGGHNDGHPFQLGVEAYIDDVPVRATHENAGPSVLLCS